MAFDDAASKILGDAFDAACGDPHAMAYSDLLRELIATRIITIAHTTRETDPQRLGRAALKSLGVIG